MHRVILLLIVPQTFFIAKPKIKYQATYFFDCCGSFVIDDQLINGYIRNDIAFSNSSLIAWSDSNDFYISLLLLILCCCYCCCYFTKGVCSSNFWWCCCSYCCMCFTYSSLVPHSDNHFVKNSLPTMNSSSVVYDFITITLFFLLLISSNRFGIVHIWYSCSKYVVYPNRIALLSLLLSLFFCVSNRFSFY